MEKMTAFCGLVCTDCPAYIATQKDDNEARKKVVEKWSSEQFPLKIEDINCDGCLAFGKRLIKFCDMCEVRACAIKKNVKTCAHCDEFSCEKLNKHFQMIGTEAKANLERIRKDL